MHKSRLGTLVIDCQTTNVEEAARFWAAALGRASHVSPDPNDRNFSVLRGPTEDLAVLVQAVEHDSHVHLDIETDDIEAEVVRLESLGAKRVSFVKRWWVMQAPTGHRFCVGSPQHPDFEERATVWPDSNGRSAL